MLFWRRDASYGDVWITFFVVCVGIALAITFTLLLIPAFAAADTSSVIEASNPHEPAVEFGMAGGNLQERTGDHRRQRGRLTATRAALPATTRANTSSKKPAPIRTTASPSSSSVTGPARQADQRTGVRPCRPAGGAGGQPRRDRAAARSKPSKRRPRTAAENTIVGESGVTAWAVDPAAAAERTHRGQGLQPRPAAGPAGPLRPRTARQRSLPRRRHRLGRATTTRASRSRSRTRCRSTSVR